MPAGTSNSSISNGPKAKVGATDFFLHLGFIAALYTFIGTFISFLYSVINTVFPDRQYNYYDPYASGMRFSVSMLIVVTPLMLFLLKKIYTHLRTEPAKKDLWIRKWGLYLTLTLAIIALAIDLVTLINTFLGGEITTRFILKALTVIIVGVLVWLFTRREIKNSLADAPKLAKSLGWGIIALIVISLIVGFSYIGSPTLLRNIRDDNQRENDLQTLKYQVVNYYQSKGGKLPSTLDEMRLGDPYAMELPKDPSTEQPYEYKILPDRVVTASTTPGSKPAAPVKFPTFALCATFSEDGKADERVQNAGGTGRGDIAPMPAMDMGSSAYPYYPDNIQFNDHPAGNKCFEVSIDPQRYKPYNTEVMPVDAKGM
jgi:hypothetical protein